MVVEKCVYEFIDVEIVVFFFCGKIFGYVLEKMFKDFICVVKVCCFIIFCIKVILEFINFLE